MTTTYLLIGSHDPYEYQGASRLHSLASDLCDAGHAVTLMLVENGVLGARRSRASAALSELADKGVRVLADDFSLRERGIDPARLQRGVQPAAIDTAVEQLERGAVALWH